MNEREKSLELCLRCMVILEDAGYELERIASGMIVCRECGRRCWGGSFRVHGPRRKEAAE